MRTVSWMVVAAFALGGCSGGESQGASTPKGGDVTLGAPAEKGDQGETLATIGKSTIGVEAFKHQAQRRQPADGKALTPEERKTVLDELVTEEVLFQEALKRGLYSDTKVRKILVNLLLREDVYAKVSNDDFSDEELTAYYDSHKDDFVVPEKVQVRRIFLKVSDARDDGATKALANQLHKDLVKDKRVFGDLAVQHSDGPYKRRGGDLGFVAREGKPGVDPAVIEKAFALAVEELSPPFLAGDGYHILYVVNKRERVERSFQQMKGSVVRMVKQERFKTLTDEYIAKTRANYDVSVDATKLDGVDLKRSVRPAPGAGADPALKMQPGKRAPSKAAPGGDGHGH